MSYIWFQDPSQEIPRLWIACIQGYTAYIHAKEDKYVVRLMFGSALASSTFMDTLEEAKADAIIMAETFSKHRVFRVVESGEPFKPMRDELARRRAKQATLAQ
jgi:hypothetical protein